MNDKGRDTFILIGLACGAVLLIGALKAMLPVIIVGGVVYAAYRYITRPK